MTMITTRVLGILTLTVGVTLGAGGGRALSGDLPVKRTSLIQTGFVGCGARRANMYVTEIGPGVDAGRHFHYAHTFVYVLDGAITIEEEGKPPVTYRAGEAFQEPPLKRHDARNASATAPLKIVVFQAPEPGQPLAETVK
jgi:quercetin dioxygenase-like cupin family protein